MGIQTRHRIPSCRLIRSLRFQREKSGIPLHNLAPARDPKSGCAQPAYCKRNPTKRLNFALELFLGEMADIPLACEVLVARQ